MTGVGVGASPAFTRRTGGSTDSHGDGGEGGSKSSAVTTEKRLLKEMVSL